MAKRKNIVTVHGADALHRTDATLRKRGYIPAPMPDDFGHVSRKTGINLGSWDDFIATKLQCGEGGKPSHQYPTLHLSSGGEVPVPDKGTKDLGYMAWGQYNNNPNVVSLLTEASPYTSSAHRFNTDLCAGRGPRPVFHYCQYVGGNITEKTIPHRDAGILLRGWLRDLRRELQQEQSATVSDASASAPSSAPVPAASASGNQDSPLAADLRQQIADIEALLAQWQKDSEAVKAFQRRNNLHLTFLSLTEDMQQQNICFPELSLNKRTLNKEGKNLPTSMWEPQIVGIRYRSAHICRLERKDKKGRINYVYISNQWLDHSTTTTHTENYKIDVLPALEPQSPVSDLERIIRETRAANGSIRRRPTRFILPVSYPSAGRPYYPVPANQSIYSGDIYEYLMTMISDRNRRRKNSNVIGRIIYLNNEYMERLYFQRKADTPDDKLKVFNELRDQINSFLQDRDNVGKPLVAYTFLGSDGKTYESWKIVEIEANDKGSVEANQKELAEISSVVFFAYGLDSRLVGNTPGDVTSSGGTDLRERYMLKQLQMSPMQALLLTPLYVVSQFNQWQTVDWEIPREVLTTLDNSKTGITTQPQP